MRASLLLASAFTTLVASLPAWDQSPYDPSPYHRHSPYHPSPYHPSPYHPSPYDRSRYDDSLFELGVCPKFGPMQMFLLDESNPDQVIPLFNRFQVFQGPQATNRQYIYVPFPPTEAGASACELHWTLPMTVVPLEQNAGQLDVKTVAPLDDLPTWNKVIPKMQPGVFGTVNTLPPQDVVVNTAQCSNVPDGKGLGFIFKLAQYIEQSGVHAVYQFRPGQFQSEPSPNYGGPYLSSQC